MSELRKVERICLPQFVRLVLPEARDKLMSSARPPKVVLCDPDYSQFEIEKRGGLLTESGAKAE